MKSYDPEIFFNDIQSSAARFGSQFSESTTRKMLEIFHPWFSIGVLRWRLTDRITDNLNYRLLLPKPNDVVSVAVESGILDSKCPLLVLVRFWSELPGEKPVLWHDFDTCNGLAKTWIHLGEPRDLDEIIESKFVPETIQRQSECLQTNHLRRARIAAVDYRKGSVNLYFRVSKSLTESDASAITGLAGVVTPNSRQIKEIQKLSPQHAYVVSTTIGLESGVIERVCFYAFMLSPMCLTLTPRLNDFVSDIPCYVDEDLLVPGWSFGCGSSSYMKLGLGYFGNYRNVLQDWSEFFE
jgi:4-hydroxyphenylpyruvate 3-dimethylallyltransferase